MSKPDPALDFKELFSQAQQDCWHAARALSALGSLAEGDGKLTADGRPRTLEFVKAEEFACLMQLLSDRMDLKGKPREVFL